MAIVRLGHTTIVGAADASGGTSGAVDTTGAIFIVQVTGAQNGNNPTVSDSKGNSWTTAVAHGEINHQVLIHYAYNANVGTGHTFSVDGTLTNASTEIAWYSGVASGDPLDQRNSSTNSGSATIQAGSITPTDDGQLVIAGFSSNWVSAPPQSINQSFAIIDQQQAATGYYGSGLGELIQGSAAAVNPTWTGTGTPVALCAAIASFKAAPGATMDVAITETPDVIAGSLASTFLVSVAITESPDVVAASLNSTFNTAIAITESPDIVAVNFLAEALLAIAITESPDAFFANIGYDVNISIAIGSEDADTVSIILENAGSWANCGPNSTDWTDCTDPATTWTQCPSPSTNWTVN